jgi:dTDP-4-dehydrorhamnose reductase
VFGGDPGAPYTEEAPASPVNCYGESKLEGEIGVRANNPRHIIVRTAWVHSPFGSNFVKTILKLAGERDELSVVSDQRGNPTSAREVARACLHITNEFSRSHQPTRFGTYHFCGSGEATWFDFARAIIQMAGLRTKIRPIRTSDYKTAAVRAADTRLNCDAIKENYNLSAQPWRLGLQDTLARLNV